MQTAGRDIIEGNVYIPKNYIVCTCQFWYDIRDADRLRFI